MTLERKTNEAKAVWNNSATSEEINVEGFNFAAAIALPPGFAGTSLTYQALGINNDGTDRWAPLASGGVQLTHSVVAGSVEAMPAGIQGVKRIRLVSNATETATARVYLTS